MAFCFRVFPRISLMGKERKYTKILFSPEIKTSVKNMIPPLDFFYKPSWAENRLLPSSFYQLSLQLAGQLRP